MTTHLCSFLVLINLADIVVSFDLRQDCQVIENFIVDPIQYDSVDFNALFNAHKDKMLEVYLFCENDPYKNFDIITIDKQVCINISRSKTKTQCMENMPAFNKGWKDFSLTLEGTYTLRNGRDTTWISYNKSSDCTISRIEVTGTLMRHCPTQTPTWLIEGSRIQEIPLLSKGVSNSNEELILYSSKQFKPTLVVCNTKLWIGRSNNILDVREEEFVFPVPRFTSKLLLSFEEEGSAIKVKIVAGGREVYSKMCGQRPTYLQAFGGQSDHYFLMQVLHPNVNKTKANERATHSPNIFLPTGVIFLCTVIIIKLGIWNLFQLTKLKEIYPEVTIYSRPTLEAITRSSSITVPWDFPPVVPPLIIDDVLEL